MAPRSFPILLGVGQPQERGDWRRSEDGPIDYRDNSDTKVALEASYLQCSDSQQDEVRRRASENFKAFLSRIQGELKATSEPS